jgi:hypothetical protein
VCPRPTCTEMYSLISALRGIQFCSSSCFSFASLRPANRKELLILLPCVCFDNHPGSMTFSLNLNNIFFLVLRRMYSPRNNHIGCRDINNFYYFHSFKCHENQTLCRQDTGRSITGTLRMMNIKNNNNGNYTIFVEEVMGTRIKPDILGFVNILEYLRSRNIFCR